MVILSNDVSRTVKKRERIHNIPLMGVGGVHRLPHGVVWEDARVMLRNMYEGVDRLYWGQHSEMDEC